jgi:NADH-quinone oxidoreductase subunit L
LGGKDWFIEFLAPVFSAPGHPAAHEIAREGLGLIGVAHASESATHGASSEVMTEWTLMAASLGVALAGIGLAYYLYIKNPKAPATVAARFKGIYRLLLNKYYMDEIYNAIFVQPIRSWSEWLWHSFDDGVVDGTANGTGRLVTGLSSIMKRLQTGYVQNYAIWMLVGVVVLIAYYLCR